MKFSVPIRLAALALVATAMAAPAKAGFTGYYDVSNFTLSNNNGGDGYVDTTNAPTSVDVFGSDNATGFNETDWSIIASAGTFRIYFAYTYTTQDDLGDFDPFNFTINGVTQLSVGAGVPQATPVSGTFDINLNPGDLISFQIFTQDGLFGRGDVVISNFTVISPEPATLATAFIGGIAGLLVIRRRRSA